MFDAKPGTCSGCPAEKYGLGFVPPSGSSDASMMLIGQGPGEQEAWNGVPFYHLAPIGERMEKWLGRAGISRHHILVGNIVQCWLPAKRSPSPTGIREPTQAEMKWCWNAHIGPFLDKKNREKTNLMVIVPVGVPATRFLHGIPASKGADKYMGTIQEIELPEVGKNG